MSSIQITVLVILLAYFLVLLGVSYITSRTADNHSFFRANRSAPWYLVAFGMIGTSLSGVTFVSVPGTVGAVPAGAEQPLGLTYMQVVFGYFIGYFVVAYVLLPLYYRLNVTSIYDYLRSRFGMNTYKTGALFFIVSRTLGATLRLFLVINVLQLFVLDDMNVPFGVTAIVILMMILIYTYKGGVKTIVWTDTLQTLFMLLALVVCVVWVMKGLDMGLAQAFASMGDNGFLNLFNTDVNDKRFFLKQIIGGAFITITMTGLDQEMMQKNISVKSLGDSQKNMISFSVVLVVVNFLFLFLGGLLYLYAASRGIDAKGDDLFPALAMQHLPPFISILFIVGLISALFPSADGAITALTSSFCLDILGIYRREAWSEERRTSVRKNVHLAFAAVFLVFVFFFKWINNKSIIDILLDIAGYTYGPLLGLFAFGILTRRAVADHLVPYIALASPILSIVLDKWAVQFLGGYRFGVELLVINGFLTFCGMWWISKRQEPHSESIAAK
jgi:Na+/proline symporter